MSNSPSSSNKPLIGEIDWYAIACKIRGQNEQLKQKITDLETLIEEQKQQIKVQVIKNQDYDDVLSEQEEAQSLLEAEISEYEEQVAEKTQQIEIQQATISELTQELQKIQQQTARLERECSLLQENYNEEQNKLKQIEAENKDLRIRLQRQQRYNLQYKTALDKFLDTSTQNNRDFNSLGIKSWSENESTEYVANGDNGLGLEMSSVADTWNEPPSNDFEEQEEDEVQEMESLDSENEELELESDREEEPESDEEVEDKNSPSKLFIKLPQFGLKKKNQE